MACPQKEAQQVWKEPTENWCAREDSNLHPFRDQILSLACLPFHHSRIINYQQLVFALNNVNVIETTRNGQTSAVHTRLRRHRAGTYQKAVDARKRPIRGLWVRNRKYYARISVEDQGTGRKQVRRVPWRQRPPPKLKRNCGDSRRSGKTMPCRSFG